MGKSVIRTPTASATAFAMAGAMGEKGFSPIPYTLNGPMPPSDSMVRVCMGGMSAMVGIL